MSVKGGNTMNYARWSNKEELLKVLKKIDINSSIQKSGIPMGYDKDKIYHEDITE